MVEVFLFLIWLPFVSELFLISELNEKHRLEFSV